MDWKLPTLRLEIVGNLIGHDVWDDRQSTQKHVSEVYNIVSSLLAISRISFAPFVYTNMPHCEAYIPSLFSFILKDNMLSISQSALYDI